MWRIRAREAGDRKGLVAALAHVGDYPSRPPADPARWLYRDDVLAAWVAESDGRVVGHVSLRRAGRQMPVRLWCAASGRAADECTMVARLFVVPAARRTGLGRTLVGAAVAEAAARGLHPILDVADANRAAIRLYERLGWVRFGEHVETFDDDGPSELLHCYTAP